MFKAGTLTILCLAVLASACASTGAVPQPFPTPGGPTVARKSPPSGPQPTGTSGTTPVSDGYAIAGTALSLRGTPYRNGGRDPSGFDCSGFIWYVFAQHGIRVARTVGEQFQEGFDVPFGALEAGDLVFFSTNAPGVSHVGMAIGGDEFVHAPSSRGEVRVERFSSAYWAGRMVGARRIR
jgi:cell wall-associated NlpC family hydrolase